MRAAISCLDEMLTVAAMLSAERVFLGGAGPEGGGPSGGGGRDGGQPQRREEIARLARECQGDHILLLRLYQLWAAGGFSREFCKSHGLDLRGMNFARDVRRQLEGVVGPGGRALEAQAARGERGGGGGGDSGDEEGGGRQQQQQQHQHHQHHHHGEERDRKRRRSDDGGGGGDGRAVNGGSNGGARPRGSGSAGGASTQPPSAARLDALRRALAIGFANRLARRMRMHNGYKTANGAGQLAQLHPSSARLEADEDGLLPEWVVYLELVATSRPFLRQVCPVDARAVAPLLPKLGEADVRRLSKGRLLAEREAAAAAAAAAAKGGGGGAAGDAARAGGSGGGGGGAAAAAAAPAVKRADDKAVDAARQRYLARKQQQQAAAAAAGKKR